METTLYYLERLAKAYIRDYHVLKSSDRLRWLGGMEAYLIEIGKIQAGLVSHEYLVVETKILGFIPRKRPETYEEFILRLVNEVINEKDEKHME